MRQSHRRATPEIQILKSKPQCSGSRFTVTKKRFQTQVFKTHNQKNLPLRKIQFLKKRLGNHWVFLGPDPIRNRNKARPYKLAGSLFQIKPFCIENWKFCSWKPGIWLRKAIFYISYCWGWLLTGRGLRYTNCTDKIIKKKKKLSSYIRKFRRDRLQSHMTNGLLIYAHFLI